MGSGDWGLGNGDAAKWSLGRDEAPSTVDLRALERQLGGAAVDDDCLPDDRGGAVGTEPEAGGGYLLGRDVAADGVGGGEAGAKPLIAGGEPREHGGIRGAGADGVDADASARIFGGCRPRQSENTVLAGAVGRRTFAATQRGR